ncbi:MAG: HD domain-containing protein [Clostridiales bacterium]|nr:HD domain-containing protein [Clostridiales bacterium]
MIDEDRQKHILAVANLMRENANRFGLDEEEMFMLGYLHDIGYAFGDGENHHTVGAELLQKHNYKYYREVLYHGKPVENYTSRALDLLNFGDMHIGKKGNYLTFEDRLEDIKSRRGENSPHYQNCKKVIDRLQNILLEIEENSQVDDNNL